MLEECLRRLWAGWIYIQVELQGHYSNDRLQQVHSYIKQLRFERVLLICLLTPLPSLVLSILCELPPLTSPAEGVYRNGVFFFRCWISINYVGGSVLVQMGQGVPCLKLKAWQIVVIAVLAGTIAIAILFMVSALTVFPFPFGLLVAAPPNAIVIATCFAFILRPQWRADPSLWEDIKRELGVYHCLVMLTFIYPLYIFGFVSLTGISQAIFVIVLPIIKLGAKNVFSHVLGDQHDLKPEYVVFSVEIFNALYVSNALQSATSWSSTAIIMLVDAAQLWISILDVVKLMNEINDLLVKIPSDHPLRNEHFLEVALRIIAADNYKKTNILVAQSRQKEDVPEKDRIAVMTEDRILWIHPSSKPLVASNSRTELPDSTINDQLCLSLQVSDLMKVVPIDAEPKCLGSTKTMFASEKVTNNYAECGVETILTRSERVRLMHKSRELLFVTEYIVLMEYVEVVLPIIYSLHRVVLFQMHNGVYNLSLAGYTSEQVLSSIFNVMVYSLFEFVSFVVSIAILDRLLGFSSLRQLCFILERHAGVVQAKLTVVFLYVMQVPLQHLGSDFSFKFAWLHPDS